MKKHCSISVVLLFSATATIFAQSTIFKPFKVDTGIEFSISADDEAGSGMGFYIAPIYNATDRLSIGARFGFAYAGAGNINIGLTNVEIEATNLFSFLMVGDYYLSTEKVRPFVGLGVGMYKRGDSTVKTGIGVVDISRDTKTNFGVKPRVGLNVGHFKMTIDYNVTGSEIHDYVGFTLGVDIGGGPI